MYGQGIRIRGMMKAPLPPLLLKQRVSFRSYIAATLATLATVSCLIRARLDLLMKHLIQKATTFQTYLYSLMLSLPFPFLHT
jgi:hypothetical protein